MFYNTDLILLKKQANYLHLLYTADDRAFP